MIEAAIFDWDGTVVDSRDALFGAWHAATGEVLGRRFPSSVDDERLVLTLAGATIFPLVAGDPDVGVRLADVFEDAYAQTGHLVRAFAGMPQVLGELRAAGLAIGVVTSKSRRRMAADARHVGVEALIDVAVCEEDTTAHKPDAEPVLRVLQELGVAPARAVMTGDTPVDVAAGAAAGTAVLGVAWGATDPATLLEAGASAVAADPADLPRLVVDLGDPGAAGRR